MLRITLIFLLSINTLLAQKLEPIVQWGQEFKAPRRSSLVDIVGHDHTGIYAVKERMGGSFSNAKFTLEHYDTKFTPTRSVDLDFRENGIEVNVNMILQLRGKLYMFTSVPNSKTKKNVMSVQQIDKASLQPTGDKFPIAEIDFKGELRSNSGSFRVKVSRDSSKVLVLYDLPFKRNEPEELGMSVLGDDLRLIWNKQIKLPFEDELFDIDSYRVDNDGDVYLLGLIYNERRKSKRRGLPNYKYQIFAYRDKGNTLNEYPIALKDKFITDMQIEVLSNKNLICAGFYSEKGTYSIRGTYFLTVDAKNAQIKTQSFKEFGIDFITANMTENQAERIKKKEERGGENELYEYDLDKLLVGKDGSAIMLGEQYYVNTTTNSYMSGGRMQTYTNTHYYYNDIIAVKISPAGQIEWAEKIAKRQHTINDGGFYSSYMMAIVKGNLCFIFNDHPNNLSYGGIGRVANYNGGQSFVIMVTLDQSGKQTRMPLFRSVDVDVITRPKVCEQITNNQIILFGQRRKNQQFASVTFE